MRNRIGGWAWRLLPAVALLAAVPGLAQGDWNQAYGDTGNSSSVNVATDIGVRPLWSVQLNGPVAWGGPAIGRGETVYLGTTNGIFNAFWPDGKFRCAVFFPGGVFASTPAVLPGGEVAVLFQRPAAPGMQGFLALLSEDCKPIWETELPRWTPEGNGVSSGSVKVWTQPSTGASFLFVHGRDTRLADVSTPNPDNETSNELLVYTADGRLFARYPVGDICFELHGGGWANPLADIWDFLTGLWPSTGTLPPLYEQLGWPDSTPAVMPLNAAQITQLEEGFVDQGGRLQGMTRPLALQLVGGEGSQLAVDHRDEVLQRLIVAALPGTQELGDLSVQYVDRT